MQLAPEAAASVAPQKLRRGPVSRGQQKRSGSGITTADNTPTVPPLPLTPAAVDTAALLGRGRREWCRPGPERHQSAAVLTA